MTFDKSLHPDCVEGPLGLPFKESVAKQVDDLLKQHKATAEERVVKLASSADVSVEADRTEVSKITTEAVDKDREVIIANGVDLSAYKSNPVVLLNHDWNSLPLGKSLWIKDHGSGLTAKSQYAKRPSEWGKDREWLPESVYELIKQGMMPGKSIGFLPLDVRSPTKAEISERPELKDVRRVYAKTLMVEYSVVTIPSNNEALVEAVAKSYPGLAAVLGLKAAEPDDETPPPTIESLMTELEALKAATPDVQPLVARIIELEADREALKIAIRSIRKDLLAAPKQTMVQMPPRSLLADVVKELKKSGLSG